MKLSTFPVLAFIFLHIVGQEREFTYVVQHVNVSHYILKDIVVFPTARTWTLLAMMICGYDGCVMERVRDIRNPSRVASSPQPLMNNLKSQWTH